MPLSEEEQRILRQIEEQFHAEDPKFAREVSRVTSPSQASRNLKLAVCGVLAGLVLMVAFLAVASSVPLSLLSFLLAFASGVWAYYSFRQMAHEGAAELGRPHWARGLSAERFKRRSADSDED